VPPAHDLDDQLGEAVGVEIAGRDRRASGTSGRCGTLSVAMSVLRTTAGRSLALSLAASLVSFATAGLAVGQDRGGGREERGAPEGADREPDAPATSDDEVDAESEVVERGGEKVKAIRFTGLDVAGRLKSPQLLYFLNRLRAEFDRPRLPHRSFLPEMERSTHGKSF
jgi:hypothetical protein